MKIAEYTLAQLHAVTADRQSDMSEVCIDTVTAVCLLCPPEKPETAGKGKLIVRTNKHKTLHAEYSVVPADSPAAISVF